VFSVPLRGDKANGVDRGMNFIRPIKDIEAMEIEVYLRIEFHSGCIYWIMNAMVKLANP